MQYFVKTFINRTFCLNLRKKSNGMPAGIPFALSSEINLHFPFTAVCPAVIGNQAYFCRNFLRL